MTVHALTSESPKAADRAAGLFTDWLKELPEGALRRRVAQLAECFRELNNEELLLAVAWLGSDSLYMCGAWRVDGWTEIVGPYVHRDRRRMTMGGSALTAAFRMAWSEQDVHLHVPASYGWATEVLEREGMERVAPMLEDGIGDQLSFHWNMARRASHFLRRMHEPSGGGSWVVLMHNDDITTLPFVIDSLVRAIDVNQDIATEHARLIHSAGVSPIRYCRTERGARNLAARIERMAKNEGFPLRVTYERRR